MQNGHGGESDECVELGFSESEETVQRNYPGEQMSDEERLSWIPLKVLL